MESTTSCELPRYRCYKEVWALKIKEVVLLQIGAEITPEDPGYAPFIVSEAYVLKHDPQSGGYWVRYSDGYESFSPATAFESGYTRIK